MLNKFKWTILWSIFVLTLCGLPGDQIPHSSWMDVWMIDKVVHAGLYAPLVVLFLIESKGDFKFLALFYGILLGVFIEVLQHFVFYKRSFDVLDMLANSFGCFVGYFVFFKMIYKKNE